MAEVITPKRQVVVDRLRHRIENYRKHQSDCIPRFQQAFTGLVEENVHDTLALKQRYMENKSKRAAKKTEKKIPDNPLQGLHAVTFLPKRPEGDNHDGYSHGEGPPLSKQQSNPSPAEPLTKFSVEIVQQLEFTTSAGNNTQISTNVTVKTLNTSVKSDLSTTTVSLKSPTPTMVECKREQEDNPEFVDLEQCAAALEKDAEANGGNSFPGLSGLIGGETSDTIIMSDTFKDLISEVSDFHPAFLKDLNFVGGGTKHNIQSENQTYNNHHHQQKQHVLKTEDDSKNNILGVHQQQRIYSLGMDFAKTELSPAAQTLKQMSEQHQHKTPLGMNFNPSSKPYSEFQYSNSDFIGSHQNNNVNSQYKPMMSQSPKSNYMSSDNIKQEVFSAPNLPGVYSLGSSKGNQTPTGQPRLNTGFKQQYSPYDSPRVGSPQYTPRAPSQGPPPQTPPPPPSSPSSTILQINQAQQLHICQAQGQPIQQQVRPSPPECKVSKQQMHQLHPSVVQHQNFLPQQHNSQQPLPPSGPMIRPGVGGSVCGGYMVSGGGTRLQYTRTQRPLSPEWRHMLQHQLQRPTFHQGQGVMFSGGDMQMRAKQMQQISHLSQHQSLAMQHSTPQMSVNLQMQQNMGGFRQHRPHPPTTQMSFPSSQTFTHSHATSQYKSPYTSLPLQLPSTNNFNLDFLDHGQDLLSSLESRASFNIHDIM